MFDPRLLLANIIIISLIFAFVALLLVGIAYFFSTGAVKERYISRQAKEDYQQARGTAHRQLLERADSRIRKQLAERRKRIDHAQKEKRRLVMLRSQDVDAKLTRYLVEHRLQEVRGIGDSLQRQITLHVFRGNLSDLRRAHHIHGVGEQKQWYINQWVRKYEAKLPKLRQQDFPGKQEVANRYRPSINEQEKLLQEAEADQSNLNARLKPIRHELVWLREVSSKLFVRAYKKQEEELPVIDRYLKGVFSEWESMPGWFRSEISDEAAKKLVGNA